jgi:hypothetical protein
MWFSVVYTRKKSKETHAFTVKSMGLLVIVFTGKKKGNNQPGEIYFNESNQAQDMY